MSHTEQREPVFLHFPDATLVVCIYLQARRVPVTDSKIFAEADVPWM